MTTAAQCTGLISMLWLITLPCLTVTRTRPRLICTTTSVRSRTLSPCFPLPGHSQQRTTTERLQLFHHGSFRKYKKKRLTVQFTTDVKGKRVHQIMHRACIMPVIVPYVTDQSPVRRRVGTAVGDIGCVVWLVAASWSPHVCFVLFWTVQ